MGYSKRYQLKRLRFYLTMSSSKRSKIIMKDNIFKNCGENIRWQPRKLPADPELIELHNNISIASNVTFITHDVFRFILNTKYNPGKEIFKKKLGPIEIMDNVAIGANVTILPNVKIGPNAIVGAGSIVTKDVPEGKIVAGNPARVIGDFDNLVSKRLVGTVAETPEQAWEVFNKSRII